MKSKQGLTKKQLRLRNEYIARISGKVAAPCCEAKKPLFRGDQSKRKPMKPKKPKLDRRRKKKPVLVMTATEAYVQYGNKKIALE